MFGSDQKQPQIEEKPKKLEPIYRRTIYKLEVKKVEIWDIPQTQYEKGSNEEDSYVQTGKYKEENKNEQTMYEQKFEENDLNVRELALWANRVK